MPQLKTHLMRKDLPSDRPADHDDPPIFMRGEREAVWYLKIGALGYKIPFCKYLYGHALINGTGGIKKDILKVIGFLHDAGTGLLIAEAFFELGIIYERGIELGTGQDIDKDYAKAQHFYQDSIQASMFNITLMKNNSTILWVPEIKVADH